MTSVVQTQGIQALLAAEKAAEETITKARNNKVKRMKQARDEADEEVKKIQSQRETQFREYVNKNSGNNDQQAQKLKEETLRQLKEMEKTVSNNESKIVKMLLNTVYEVKPRKHINLRGSST
eukprot:Sdes_comp19084_c0_seq4m9722